MARYQGASDVENEICDTRSIYLGRMKNKIKIKNKIKNKKEIKNKKKKKMKIKSMKKT